jgi:DNA repair protein SbcD/Mre11
MKFAHMADVHIGSWRDPRLKDLSTDAFIKAMHICIESNVDFILISGDLFNTALPGIDSLKTVVKEFKKTHMRNIPVYIIPGSHDFSPSGKTMIDVLEEAGLVINVVKGTVKEGKLFLKFTIDEKTGVKITGLLGKRGTLEKHYYEKLDIEHLEKESGRKIFMFHSAIKELMPNDYGQMDSGAIIIAERF